MSDYTGPERPFREPSQESPADRIITGLGIIERLLKGGFLERERQTVTASGRGA